MAFSSWKELCDLNLKSGTRSTLRKQRSPQVQGLQPGRSAAGKAKIKTLRDFVDDTAWSRQVSLKVRAKVPQGSCPTIQSQGLPHTKFCSLPQPKTTVLL